MSRYAGRRRPVRSRVAEYEKHTMNGSADWRRCKPFSWWSAEFAELLQNHPDPISSSILPRRPIANACTCLLATRSLNTGGVPDRQLRPNLTYRVPLPAPAIQGGDGTRRYMPARRRCRVPAGRDGRASEGSTAYRHQHNAPPCSNPVKRRRIAGQRQVVRIQPFTAAPLLDAATRPPVPGVSS